MSAQVAGKWIRRVAVVLALWLAVRYLLPVAIPFLIGGGIALMAEPGVRLLHNRARFPRVAAAGVCVGLTLILLLTVLSLLGAAAVKELGNVAQLAPQAGQTVEKGLRVLEDWLVSLADRAPDNLRPMLIQSVMRTFQGGTTLVNQVTEKIPGAVASVVGWASRGALTVGTGVLAAFLISVRLPKIKKAAALQLPDSWKEKILPAVQRVKNTFGKWLKAQLKLMSVTWAAVTAGFLLLGIPYAPLWAAAVALVDAVPVLGTGTVLVPWAIVCFLQENTVQGLGLLSVFGAASLLRSVLEPRWVGKSLGIDPLVSLAAFYIGLKLWGVVGMILAPMAVALIKGLLDSSKFDHSQIIHKETP